MIKIDDNKDCCGCNACIIACPKQCISRTTDSEGFWYPVVDLSKCIDCSLCEKVCPELNENQESKPLECLAAINNDLEIRKNSSSGGVFFELARLTIQDGGVVFGAKFNEKWEVVHDMSKTLDYLSMFRGSKYVQSDTIKTYSQVKDYLKNNTKVLFSGTPCQIAGLKRFLRKEYEKLITVDFICHGVPSPFVWSKYLDALPLDRNKIQSISFRDKAKGWKLFSLSIQGENFHYHKKLNEDLYVRGFLKDLYLRPSCYSCSAKAGKSGSDITLADFWGIQNIKPEIDDDKGVSAILLNTTKGNEYFNRANLSTYKCSYEEILKYNPSLVQSVKEPLGRVQFFEKFNNSEISLLKILEELTKVPFSSIQLLKKVVRIILNKVGLLPTVKRLIK